MKSKIIRLAFIAVLAAAQNSFYLQAHSDLALLEQQLTALNQNLPHRAQQPAEIKELASLQRFIDFKHPAFKQLNLDHDKNYAAPLVIPVEIQIKPDVELVQILTAWQDLPIKAFLGLSDGILEAKHKLTDLYYRNTKQMLDLLRHYNNNLFSMAQETALREKFSKHEDILLGGGPASCGYHALKNLILATNLIFSAGMAPKDYFVSVGLLIDLRLTNNLFGIAEQYQAITGTAGMGLWRTAIVNQLNQQKSANTAAGLLVSENNGEWLTDTGLDWLVAALKNNRIQTGLNSDQSNKLFSVLNRPSCVIQIYRSKELLKQFRDAYLANKNFTGALFINPGAHWFTLMVNKIDGKTQFIMLDSKNTPNYSSIPGEPANKGAQQVIEIISALTRIAPEDIQQKLKVQLTQQETAERQKMLSELIPAATSQEKALTREDMKKLGMSDKEIDEALRAEAEAEKNRRN